MEIKIEYIEEEIDIRFESLINQLEEARKKLKEKFNYLKPKIVIK
jgi:hypothetical protein